MDSILQQIDRFFDLYSERFNKALKGEGVDVEEAAGSFGECFIEASPLGVNCGKNDEQFRNMISQGYAYYKGIGITSMDIISKQTTILDNFHTMTRVHWGCSFQKKDSTRGSIDFDVIYFLQTKENTLKIFAYIAGDEQAALKDIGLING